jgi:uncharacterized protein
VTTAIDPELLERLRRGVPLRLSAGGTWWFGDEMVTHPGVARALTAGVDLSDGGEPIVALGPQWCYVTIDDTPLFVDAVLRGAGDDELMVRLDDGRVLPLDPTSLREDPRQGLSCAVPSRGKGLPLRARFTNQAQLDLLPWLAWDEKSDRALLQLGVRRIAIPC